MSTLDGKIATYQLWQGVGSLTHHKHRNTFKDKGEVIKEIKEGVERESARYNDAYMMAENVGEYKGHDIRRESKSHYCTFPFSL